MAGRSDLVLRLYIEPRTSAVARSSHRLQPPWACLLDDAAQRLKEMLTIT